jgi:hypothetical protein
LHVSNWFLDSADDVSADGRTIVGNGSCSNTERGFLVRLPASASELDVEAGEP